MQWLVHGTGLVFIDNRQTPVSISQRRQAVSHTTMHVSISSVLSTTPVGRRQREIPRLWQTERPCITPSLPATDAVSLSDAPTTIITQSNTTPVGRRQWVIPRLWQTERPCITPSLPATDAVSLSDAPTTIITQSKVVKL